MTIDEAINVEEAETLAHEQTLNSLDDNMPNDMREVFEKSIGKNMEYHRQLAEWLKELKAYRERIPSHEAGYNDVIKEIALSEECARAYTRGYEKAMEYCTNKLSELNKQFANGGKR